MADFFAGLGGGIYTVFNMVWAALSGIRFADILDIAVVAYVIYKCIQLFRETRAKQLIRGIIILFFVWVFAIWWDLVSIKWLLIKVFDYAIIGVAIIFQPELRRALERMGRSQFGIFGRGSDRNREETLKCIDAVSKATQNMQEQKVGALIVFERTTPLGEIINTGTVLDAEATMPLIDNVFFPKSPLHDGAVIIRENRVHAAGCILPLTSRADLSHHLGTRHRAAVGMSENSDAVVLVVSEETGNISIAENGNLTRDYTAITLREALKTLLLDEEENNNKGLFSDLWDRIKKILKKQ